MALIWVEPATCAATHRPNSRIGSTSTPSIASRLLPSAVNGLPVSRPEMAKKKRAMANR
ncbi:Uncharacterised protein [Klebsiella pneumoniae]|uniref:Uncharacterized protein n=1 Tax=Klebsiella pneumoniae TaxID=573 RepID=A0A378FQP5_KLEPN|nr:Uncharacterised protein [Klebsiella pneumoniae]